MGDTKDVSSRGGAPGGLGFDAATTDLVPQSTRDAWRQALADAGLSPDAPGDDGGWGGSGGANTAFGATDAPLPWATTAGLDRDGTAPDRPFTLASDTTARRYPAPPFSQFSPVSPESHDFADAAGEGLKAVGDAIQGALNNQSRGGAADGTNKPAGTSGATAAAAGATPPEDPDDLKQQRFRAKVDRDLNDIQEATDNATYDHLKDSDLDAARRELNGEVVSRRPDGKSFDHVGEVITGQRSPIEGIKRIKSMMDRVPINTPQYARLERMLGTLSNRLDYSRNFVPKGTASPSNPNLVAP